MDVFIFIIFIKMIQQGDFITIAISNFVEVWKNVLKFKFNFAHVGHIWSGLHFVENISSEYHYLSQ